MSDCAETLRELEPFLDGELAEEEEDENLAPNATSSGFAFGLSAPPAVGATAFGQPAAQPAFAF